MVVEVAGAIQVGALPGGDEAPPGLAGLVPARERVLQRERDSMADGEGPGIVELAFWHFTEDRSLLPGDVDDRRGQVDEVLPAQVAGLVDEDVDGVSHGG